MADETTSKYTEQEVPNVQDSENAVLEQYADLRGMRYMEFFLVGSVPVNGQIKGTCYNTTHYNLTPGGRDSCPQELVEKLDPAELAKQYGVSHVVLNPPRQWLLDQIDLPSGTVREFGDIQAPWVAIMNMPTGDWLPFHPATIERKTKFGFTQGQPVYLLDDPEGNTWVMKSVTAALDPENTFENLPTVAHRLNLPTGWTFRITVLDQELILIPEGGVARIVRDNLFDVYDIVGPGYSNYTP